MALHLLLFSHRDHSSVLCWYPAAHVLSILYQLSVSALLPQPTSWGLLSTLHWIKCPLLWNHRSPGDSCMSTKGRKCKELPAARVSFPDVGERGGWLAKNGGQWAPLPQPRGVLVLPAESGSLMTGGSPSDYHFHSLWVYLILPFYPTQEKNQAVRMDKQSGTLAQSFHRPYKNLSYGFLSDHIMWFI